jgi:hypothetical protein
LGGELKQEPQRRGGDGRRTDVTSPPRIGDFFS